MIDRSRRLLTAVLMTTFGAFGAGLAAEEANPDAEASAPANGGTHVVTVEDTADYIPQSNTIATRLPISPLNTPTNVGTVSERLLRDQYDLVLGTSLRNVSSVNAQTESGVADYFLIRGFDSLSSALVLTDGAAEPEVSFFQMYNVERVEVLKGPGGFLYTRTPYAGAVGGAVNIVRRQPVPGSFTGLSLSGGSYGTYQGTVDWNIANGDADFGFRLNAMYRESDYWRDDKQNRTWAVNPAFTWWLDEDSAINLNVEYVDLSYSPDSGIPVLSDGEIADVSRTNSYQSSIDFSDQTLQRVQLDYQTRLAERWNLRNKTYYRALDWKSNGTLVNGISINQFTMAPEVARSLTLLDDDQESFGNQLEAVFQTTAGGVTHNLLTGVELAVYRDTYTLDLGCDPALLGFGFCVLPALDPVDPVDGVTGVVDCTQTTPQPGEVCRQAFDSGDGETRFVAPYAIYQVEPSRWFQASFGVRLDVLDFKDNVTGEGFDDTEVNPMIGLVFKPSANNSIYASASESTSPPSVRVDDPAPEEGRQYEVGFKTDQLDGKLQASVALYQLERTNIPIPDQTGFTQQAGDQRSRGIEFDLVAEPRPGLRTFLSYAFTDAELTSFSETVFPPPTFQPQVAVYSGNGPAFVPEHLANLWVTQRFQSGIGYGGGVRYVGRQYLSESNAATIDDYTLLDAAVYYTIGRWELQLNVKNLADVDFETRGFRGTAVIPGPGRSVFGGFEVRF